MGATLTREVPQVCLADHDIVWSSRKREVKRDKTKGIVCKPMPKYWYDYRAIEKPEGDSPERLAMYELNRRIVADKKPYFMQYIYSQIMVDYNNYVKRANMNSLAMFRTELCDLLKTPPSERTEEQNKFIEYYERLMPTGTHDCVMNRICWRVEALLGGASTNNTSNQYDYSTMKSGAQYDPHVSYNLKKVYEEHMKALSEATAGPRALSFDGDEWYHRRRVAMIEGFRREVDAACNNAEEACDVVLDICYRRANTKQFAWDVVGETIIHNLLVKSGGTLSYPVLDPDGDFEYRGEKYSMLKVVAEHEGHCSE